MTNNSLSLNQLQGVIFDVDGILVDTEILQWLGWVEVLKPYGKTVTKKEYLKYAGKQGYAIEEEMKVDYDLSIEKNELSFKKEKLLLEWVHSKDLQSMPYAEDAVKFFNERQFAMACASGSPGVEARLKLQKTHLFHYFHNVVSGSDVKKGKPYPDIYLKAAASIKIDPEKCLAFEDTQYGVMSAKAAGLFCFAIPNEFSHQQDFSKADGVFENLNEAIEFLKNY